MNIRLNKYGIWCIYLIIAFLFILCFSVSISPLLGDMGLDSPLFMLIGKQILRGQRLYQDVFDHKGPVIFYLNALGMLLPDTIGMYIIESVNLGVMLILLHEICRLFLKHRRFIKHVLITAYFLLCFAFTMREGNTVNEFANMLTMISLYAGMKYFVSDSVQHPPRYAAVYAICFSLIAFMRITNGFLLVGMVLGITIHLLLCKEYRNLFYNIAGFLIGMAVITIPICVFFWIQGGLWDMLYATFLFNMTYSSTMSDPASFMFIDIFKGVLPCICTAVAISVNPHFTGYRGLRLSMVMACFFAAVSINMGVGYLNYSMIIIPLNCIAMLGMLLLKVDKKKKNRDYQMLPFLQICGFILVLFYPLWGDCYARYYTPFGVTREPLLIGNDLAVPEEERNQILAINVEFFWYIKNDVVPPYKYLGNQKWWTTFDANIAIYMEKLLASDDAPKWLLVQKYDTYLNYIMDDRYHSVQKIGNYILLKLNDGEDVGNG